MANGSAVEQPSTGGGCVGGGVDPGGAMPGGSQPPFEHVPPPIATNGSGVVQPPEFGGGGGAIPGGSQPPFEHVPPPIATNGSGIVQLSCCAEIVGNQEPFTHWPPPCDAYASEFGSPHGGWTSTSSEPPPRVEVPTVSVLSWWSSPKSLIGTTQCGSLLLAAMRPGGVRAANPVATRKIGDIGRPCLLSSTT